MAWRITYPDPGLTTEFKALGRLALVLLAACSLTASAHNLSASNADFVGTINGPAIPLFLYLGAKHMVTGIDHVLYLLAVVFFLSRPRQIFVLVTLFALGHSLTLVSGVALSLRINPHWVDALIGLSVSYKAFENLGGFSGVARFMPPAGAAVFGFGLIHGLGLATKLQSVYSGGAGFVPNLLAFNLGVELGQLLALALLLGLLFVWRARTPVQMLSYSRSFYLCNFLLLVSGFAFAGYHAIDMTLGTHG